ncbi:MAG TPA: ABC transporter ATP-binding protein [Candidatus Eisenbacteria bacterium]|nr:ABC transporter ATP-binding protein [Candidatus Eisenbacteria bacterium]
MLLQVKDLNVYYDNIHAVKDLNIEVGEGEIVCLIGANGAGKTTTLQSISGLLPIRSGQIYYKDKLLVKNKPHLITQMGIAQVPEGRRVFTNLSVLDNLRLGSYAIKDTLASKQKEIKSIYERFPILEERSTQRAGTLSGGEQQMLAIGRALMSRPKLLLLDEPSMGLSPIYVEAIFDVIKQLYNDGVTILLVEQNANIALSIASRAYVLETGRIVKKGTADALRNDPDVKAAYLGA